MPQAPGPGTIGAPPARPRGPARAGAVSRRRGPASRSQGGPPGPSAREGGKMTEREERHGVQLTNLDQPLFDGAEAAKRDLVDYLDAVRDNILPVLRDRPLSVIRVLRGQDPFMQKNVPKYTPDGRETRPVRAAASEP